MKGIRIWNKCSVRFDITRSCRAVIETSVSIPNFDTFQHLRNIWHLYRQFLHGKLLFLIKIDQDSSMKLKMNFQTSSPRFKRRKMRYRKLIKILILFYTLFRYFFQVSILLNTLLRYPIQLSILYDTSSRYQFLVSIPLLIIRYRYQVLISAIPYITSSYPDVLKYQF